MQKIPRKKMEGMLKLHKIIAGICKGKMRKKIISSNYRRYEQV